MSQSRVHIALCNPKSPSNVGAVMRAAGCYQADAIYYSGQRYQKAAKFHTDTKNIASKIPLTHADSLMESVAEGMSLVCVELVEGAIPLPEFQHPEQACYLFGPEDGNLPQALVNQADAVVYIPTIGCMNLAATVNVLLYDRLAKSSSVNMGDELIRQSRDTNNTLTVG